MALIPYKSEDAFVAVDRRRKNKKKWEKKIEMKILNIETSILNILFYCVCITECGLYIGMIYSRRPLERSKYDCH